jgi:hypothetical protein
MAKHTHDVDLNDPRDGALSIYGSLSAIAACGAI